MDSTKLAINGRDLLFAVNGDVSDPGANAVVGAWRSDSTEKDNRVHYTVDGADQAPLAAVYQFNDSNQLQMQLKNGNALSAPLVFVGGIVVNDDNDIAYALVDNAGAKTGRVVTVYGKLSFEENTNDLKIALTGGGETTIAGLNGTRSLAVEKNRIADFKAADLLTFQAETDNAIQGQDDVIVPADIQFAGSWDIQNGGLVFLSNIKSGAEGKTVSLAFAGTIGGVTAGFAYFADKEGTQLAFNIKGKHVFKSDAAHTDLAWESSLGFSGKTFKAQVSVDSTTQFADGKSLAIKGKLDLEHEKGKTLTLNLSLEATYSFDANNMLVFKAMIADGGYDLMLQGTFHYANLALTFQAEYTNKAGAKDLTVSVGITGNKDSVIQNLALVLDISESEAKVKLNLSFSVRLRFADGVRVKEIPQAA